MTKKIFAGPVLAACLLAAGCGNDGPVDIEIPFAATFGDHEFACGETFEGVGAGAGAANQQFVGADFRFYVSNVRLVDADGNEIPVELEQDGEWQHENVALLDFEDATENCAEEGTEETNTTVRGTVPGGDYTGICFDLGIPFELNHIDIDAIDAPSPLNVTAMSWGWQFGHKYLKIDGIGDPSDDEQPFSVHIGATGCVADDFDIAPEEPCDLPNIATVCLDDFPTDGSHRIAADAALLLEQADVSANINGAPGCMSGTTDDECAAIMPKLDLEFDYTGSNDPVIADREQVFFRVLHEEDHDH